jgi:hypothetical protein
MCPYLLAVRKKGAEEHFTGDPVFQAVKEQAAEVCERFPAIARGVEYASRSGIKGADRKGLRIVYSGMADEIAPQKAS